MQIVISDYTLLELLENSLRQENYEKAKAKYAKSKNINYDKTDKVMVLTAKVDQLLTLMKIEKIPVDMDFSEIYGIKQATEIIVAGRRKAVRTYNNKDFEA